ncbi:conserved hypothetical protein [Talaromyces marneffei ATCC 18224]|uniref:BYS1 domain protein n=1 Tax=Talaromyces marneffei (strain ATCC 18224 / CBS 334.59 / QM 7333) TaxID=441960 RepID=B6Q9G8_TALMQ|nr:conserved hypothetical protein [Talaromyces marneffei ATCC 18224]
MHTLFTILTAIGTLSSLVLSQNGNITILNKCDFPIWVWTIGPPENQNVMLQPEGQYVEAIYSSLGDIDIKVTVTPNGLLTPEPYMSLSYNIHEENIYYTLINVFGDPLFPKAVSLYPLESTSHECRGMRWPSGLPSNSRYKRNFCPTNKSLYLLLCT